MSFPNLNCIISQTYTVEPGASQVLLASNTALTPGLYYVTFSEDVLSPSTTINDLVAGAAFVHLNESGAVDFFTASMPIGHASTTIPMANSMTLLVLPTEVKISNTRITPSTVAVFVYRFA